jgi:hypothetical protein
MLRHSIMKYKGCLKEQELHRKELIIEFIILENNTIKCVMKERKGWKKVKGLLPAFLCN